MIYWGKKEQKEKDEQLEQEINEINTNGAFKNKANTFAQANTFNGSVNITNENFSVARIMNCGNASDGDFYILPRTNNKRTLRFGNSPNNDNKRYDLNFENRTYITNLPNPTQDFHAATKHYVDAMAPNLVYTTTMTNINFTKQVLEANKVVKYYSDKIAYNTISGAESVSKIISIMMEDIPVVGQHLVITQFCKRQNDGILIEIYQYNSPTDIAANLRGAKFQIAYTKGA